MNEPGRIDPAPTARRRAAVFSRRTHLACLSAVVTATLVVSVSHAIPDPLPPTPAVQQFLPEPIVLGPRDGLDAQAVIDVTQDRQGFLWFAALDGGLLRYDGYTFRAYNHDPADPTSISSNEVRRVYLDRDGALWVGTGDGLNRYDRDTDGFERIGTGDDATTSLQSQGIAAVLVDRRGTLWVGTEAGLDRRDAGSNKFRHYTVPKPAAGRHLAPNNFRVVYEDRDGQLWLGTLGGGLLRYNSASDSFQQYAWDGTEENHAPTSVRSIHQDRDGMLWLACDEGLSRFDPVTQRFEVLANEKTEQFRNVGLPTGRNFFSVDEDRSGRIWVSNVLFGVARWDASTRRFDTWRPRENRPTNSPGSAWKVYEDASRTLWIVGVGVPVAKFLPAAEAFEFIGVPPSTLGSEVTRGNRMEVGANGLLFIASSLGAHVLNPHTANWRELPSEASGEPNETQAVYADPHGDIWVSSLKRGQLLRLDAAGRLIRAYEVPGRSYSLHMDRSGKLWGAITYLGVMRLDPASGVIDVFKPEPQDPASLSHSGVFDVHEDRAGTIWISSRDGLNRFIPETATFKVYRNDPKDPHSISDNKTNALCEDSSRNLWILTAAGPNRYVPTTDNFVRHSIGVGTAENSLDNATCSLDSNGQFWFGAIQGLVRFDPGTGRHTTIARSDGVPEIEAGAFSAGHLFLLTRSGVVRFVPEKVRRSQTAPPLALTALSLKDQPVRPARLARDAIIRSSIWQLPEVTLSHDQYPVTIEFAALDFADPQRNQYLYKLDGVDKDWIPSSPKIRQATYTTLAPGKYTFRVKAANKDGIWNEQGTSLLLTVLPPWWRTWWAYLVYVLAGLLLLTMLVRWRTSLLRDRARELERIVDDRTRSLQEQKLTVQRQATHLEELIDLKDRLMTRISHEFRTPLTVILGPLDRLRQAATDVPIQQYLDTTRRNASRLLRLVDQMLGLARLNAGHSEPTRPVHAAPILRQVLASFDSLMIDRQVELRVGTIEDVVVQSTSDAIEKVAVNLVSNALKFTDQGGTITVDLRIQTSAGCLCVADTGRGIPADRVERIFEPFERVHDEAERIPGSGLGLTLVRELVTAQGGRIEIDSEPGRGSTFRIFWPQSPTGSEAFAQASIAMVSEEARVEVAAMREPRRPVHAMLPEPAREATVLLVEDNLDMQQYLSEVLGDRYHCMFADDGPAGIALAMQDVPDLVICDVLLPGKDGYEVCHELKSNERTSHIPIIMLTALESREHRLRGLLEKADDYLTKPFDESELKQRIANLLDIRALLRERYARDIRFDESPPADLNPRDRTFLERLTRLVARRYTEPDLDVEQLAAALAMSDRQLQRKLKALVNLSPSEYLRAYRLQEALKRLRAGERVGDVAMSVGFSSQAYFSTCFRARFGYPPTDARSHAGD